MSKRKSRKKSKPNIPQATLERARQQAGGTDAPEEQPEQKAAAAPVKAEKTAEAAPEKKAPATTEAKSRSRRRSTVSEAQLERSKKRGEVDAEFTAYMLANPNKEVTGDDLKADYGFVLRDLRNMGVLAAALMVLLVILAQFI